MAVARKVTGSNNAARNVLPDLSNTIPANGTKATPRSAVVTKDFMSPLATAIMETFDPLVKALDDKPALLKEDSADNGQSHPSMNDIALKIAFGTILSFYHRQNFGDIKVPIKDKTTGKVIRTDRYDNNKERMDKSQHALSQLEDLDDKRSFSTLYWAGVNETRFSVYNDMIHAFNAVYREIFHEDWKPMEAKTVEEKIDPKTLPEGEVSKWHQRLVEAKAANRSAA